MWRVAGGKIYKTRKWNRDVRSLSGVVFEAIFEDSLKPLGGDVRADG